MSDELKCLDSTTPESVDGLDSLDGLAGSNAEVGGTVLDEVRAWLDRFIVVTDDADLDILALWAAHTWVADETYTTPRLLIDSAVPGSGKTTVLEHLHRLCLSPIQAASLSSPALLARLLADGTRTILIDEADRALSEKNPLTGELLAVLNSGYKKGGTRPVLTPAKEGAWTVTEMTTYAPVAMAGNNPGLPDDTKSRCIRVLLLPDIDGTAEDSDWEVLEDDARKLAEKLKGWRERHRDQFKLRPDLPAEVKGRARERWSPLKRVAVTAGGRWPARVDGLAAAEVKQERDNREEGIVNTRPHIKLLQHVHELMKERDFIATEELVRLLVEMHPKVWGDESAYGRDLTAQRLGRMMSTHYKVHSAKHARDRTRGYYRKALEPAFHSLGLTGSNKPDRSSKPSKPSELEATFEPPTGNGRCAQCGFHIASQGHRDGCEVAP